MDDKQAANAAVMLSFRLLGPLEARANDLALPIGGPKQRTVLAALLTARGRVVSVADLVEAVWDGTPPSRPESTLHVYIANLRRALHAPARITTSAGGYRMSIDTAECDLLQAEAALATATAARAAGDPRGTRTAARRGLALYRGHTGDDLAAGLFARALGSEMSNLQAALAELEAGAALSLGDFSGVDGLHALALLHPSRERLWSLVIEGLARSGRQADALAAYRDVERHLRLEFGLDVTPALHALHRSVLAQGDAVMPAAMSEAAATTAIDAAHPRVVSLPTQLSAFVGREAERAELHRALDRAHLVTLTGFGGMGKTRLAIEVASERADARGASAVFVDLSMARDVAEALEAIAIAIGTDAASDPQQAVVAWLRQRDVLLVLDNVEQLLPALGPTALTLASTGPSCRVLATSRRALGVSGEHVHHLGAMQTTARGDALPDGGRLLLDRAAAGGHEIAAEDVALALGICRVLEGWPLAIELAAARLAVMKPSVLLGHLADQLRVLAVHSSATGRHGTLRATIDWSYRLLDADEALLLRDLAVFAGGADLAAVVGVCGADRDDVLKHLQSLVSWSLVRVFEDGDGNPRFGLLTAVRQYAEERLTQEPAREKQLRDRHAAYYAELVERTIAFRHNSPDVLAVVSRELDNIRLAMDHYSAQPVPEPAELQLASGVSGALWNLGLLRETMTLFTRTLERDWPPCADRFEVENGLAVAAVLRGFSADESRALLDRALATARDLGQPALTAMVLHALSFLADDSEQSELLLRQACELAGRDSGEMRRHRGHERDFVLCLIHAFLADTAVAKLDLADAVDAAVMAVKLARRSGSPSAESFALRRLAVVHQTSGKNERALEDLDDAVRAAAGLPMLLGECFAERAWLHLRMADVDACQTDLAASRSRFTDNLHSRVISAYVDVELALTTGDFEGALIKANACHELAPAGPAGWSVWSGLALARARRAVGDFRGSRSALRRVIEDCSAEPLHTGLSPALRELAAVQADAGRQAEVDELIAAADRARGVRGLPLLRLLGQRDGIDLPPAADSSPVIADVRALVDRLY
ncbi:MAG: winged helix-turn-helix domain-containing protein [Actinobacteria bacterium]|nr:winged helix-turn-helix domain-containing protein [Actinomycetota bacterium]MCA1721805.1 winged helix-turn-helix domain-containing protein [Actinomycetota bacterium]